MIEGWPHSETYGRTTMTRILAVAVCLLPLIASADDAITRTVVRQQGQDGVHTYRIPGLATTKQGTLIAVFDNRNKNSVDLPGDVDVGMCRSEDGGKTWSPMQRILDFDATEPGAQGNGVGDPAVLVDRETGTIWVAALWSHGNRSWHGSKPGTSPDETGQLVLTRSDDDGLTWSQPRNITAEIKGRNPKWRLFFQGPGSGIQLRGGELVFAAQFRDENGPPHSCLLWSGDHGETWSVTQPAIPDKPPTSESQVAELSDGSLLLTMRDESRSGKRAWARYEWQGDLGSGKWSEPWHDLPDPTCMASVIRHPSGVLLFTNCNSPQHRKDLTVRVSTDEGKTWSKGRLIDGRPCMYSCLTVLDDGTIGVLYEVGEKTGFDTLTFARFPLEWAKGE